MSEINGKNNPARPRRAPANGKRDGRTRLLDAAIDMLCRQPPSSITGRRLASNAVVHHTLIGQTFGTVAKLLAAAYARERASLITAEFNDPLRPLRPFALADHARFWRAHVHFLLDPFDPTIVAELATDQPVALAARALEAQYPGRLKSTARELAAAWWALQIGALVFEGPLARGLGISLSRRDLVRSLSGARIEQLIADCPDELAPGKVEYGLQRKPFRNPQKKLAAKEWLLIEAAAEMLTTRADAGISGRELAGRAGVNYGLIHYYFGTREAVFDQAFIHLQQICVDDFVGNKTDDSGIPFRMIAHAQFLRAWAGRELAGTAMPPVDLSGMERLLDNLASSREVDARSSQALGTAQSDALCSVALQLGWVLCHDNVTGTFEVDEIDIRSRLLRINRTFLKN